MQVKANRGVAHYGSVREHLAARSSAANHELTSSPSMREGRVPRSPWYEQGCATPASAACPRPGAQPAPCPSALPGGGTTVAAWPTNHEHRPVPSLCTPGPVNGACRDGTGVRPTPAENCAARQPRRAPAARASGEFSKGPLGRLDGRQGAGQVCGLPVSLGCFGPGRTLRTN